jgi:hypothetical protein
MFERPQKSDLDTALSVLMHESRQRLMEEVNRIKSDAIKAGALQSNRVVVTAVKAADDVDKAAMEQAHAILLDFIERMERLPAEVIAWARPHLENLNNSILGVVPPNGFPQDHQRLTQQYRAVFHQRLDIMLRDVEIGRTKGAGFARAEKMESKEEWNSAAEAVQLLAPALKGEHTAKMTLCKRAHAGMIRTRAERFIVAERAADSVEIPAVFWWAEGHAALNQNWRAGDFDTWVESHKLHRDLRFSGGKVHLEAFNVSFLRSAVEKLIPASTVSPVAQPGQGEVQPATPSPNKGGRPRREFWEELWVEISRQLYVGDLKPKTQADIEAAMHQWISDQGHESGGTAVRDRARMLWRAIEKDEN